MSVNSTHSGFPACEVCRRPVVITAGAGWVRGVTGWEEPRRQGGANKIMDRRLDGRFAHRRCIEMPELVGQDTLL